MIREVSRQLALFLVLAVPGAAAQVHSAAQDHIELINETGDEALERWLRAELDDLGYALEPDGPPPVARVRLRLDVDVVVLEIRDARGRAETRLGALSDPRAVALRTAELIHASRLPVAPAGRAPPRPAIETAPPAPDPLVIEIASFALASIPVGLTATPRVGLEAGVYLHERIIVSLGARAPLYFATFEEMEGRADVAITTGYVALTVPLIEGREPIVPRVGIEVGAHWIAALGVGNGPHLGRDVHVLTAHLALRFELDLALTEDFRLGGGGSIGLAAPQPVIAFDGREISAFGQPLIEGWLTIRGVP